MLENGADVGEMDLEGFEGGVDVKPWEGSDVTRIPDVEMEPVLEVGGGGGGVGWRGVLLFRRGKEGKGLLGAG